MGTCGGIQPDIKPGTIVICTGAVRGDGATQEYVPLEYPAIADINVVNALTESVKEIGAEYELGIVRSHDAFYIESPGVHEGGWDKRLEIWADAGVKCVENESSTLFVVSSLLGIRAGTILLCSGPIWRNHGKMGSKDFDYVEKVSLMTQICLGAMTKLDKLD